MKSKKSLRCLLWQSSSNPDEYPDISADQIYSTVNTGEIKFVTDKNTKFYIVVRQLQ